MSDFLVARTMARTLGALFLVIMGWPSRGNAVQVASDPPRKAQVAGDRWTTEKPLVGHEQKCDGGTAVVFPCQNIDLLSFLPLSTFGATMVNNLWGWTDSLTRREFVLVGMPGGTAFVEVTDPVNPRYLGRLMQQEGGRGGSLAHDIRVYRHYAFMVGEGPARGMQVFDLTQLRDVKNAPVEFQETAHYDRVDFVHTLAIDTASGVLYAVGNGGGGETCGGGLHMIDVRTPLQPAFLGCYAETLGGTRPGSGYIHESQCVVYHGPDQHYRDRQICLNAAGEGLSIVDVTDKKNPKLIGIARYPNSAFTHQGWLSENHRYFFLGDEYDEKSLAPDATKLFTVVESGRPTRTLVFDLADLSDPLLVKEYLAKTTAIDHNQYVRGRYLYQANYDAGLRILDVADPSDPKEVAYFDTDLHGRGIFQFSGAWGNYPYFTQSGLIAVTSMGEGLFLLRHRAEVTP